ncbi:MAG TPA: hypothetical protein VNN10_14500 [Dehalococcoidia bacterium]|nr:hypothetical protein [Dehalococcoidia bacterium]
MQEPDITSAGEAPAALALLWTALSVASAAVILAAAALAVAPALDLPRQPGGAELESPRAGEAGQPKRRSMIVVYVVWSEEEAERLSRSFEEWDEALRVSGLPEENVRRFFVAQSREDLMRGRYFDFSTIDPEDGPGREFRYVDLRR